MLLFKGDGAGEGAGMMPDSSSLHFKTRVKDQRNRQIAELGECANQRGAQRETRVKASSHDPANGHGGGSSSLAHLLSACSVSCRPGTRPVHFTDKKPGSESAPFKFRFRGLLISLFVCTKSSFLTGRTHELWGQYPQVPLWPVEITCESNRLKFFS